MNVMNGLLLISRWYHNYIRAKSRKITKIGTLACEHDVEM